MKGLDKAKGLGRIRLNLPPARHAERPRAGLFVLGKERLNVPACLS